MTTSIQQIPEPGQIARIRQRLYLVEKITKGKSVKDATLVSMSCVDDDAQGQPLDALWENEIEAEIISGENWDAIARCGLDEPGIFSAYLNTLKWNCVTATNPKLFQSPFRAGIKLEAYQLEPLRKALRLPRVNLFIADDVGLGKTIEAGLIARELLLRKRIREIVVSAPPSMLEQWKEELEVRFGLTFEILDRDYIQRVRQERGFGVNPWSTHSRFLISHKLLIREEYAGPLRAWLDDFRSGTLFILDEAHHAAPSSGAKYAIDTKITRAVEDFAKRFEHRLFLSATPHNGHSNSFSRLLELLDPQRFCRGVTPEPDSLEQVIVRRLKGDMRAVRGGFPERKVVPVVIDGLPKDSPDLELTRLLDEYRETQEERLKSQTKKSRAASGLLITGLQKRLLSSTEAFAHTLSVHRETVKRRWEAFKKKQEIDEEKFASVKQLDLLAQGVGSDDDRAELSEEELQSEQDAQITAASNATVFDAENAEAVALWNREQEILDQLTELAESNRGRPDAKVRALLDWMREHMCPDLGESGADWNDTRVIIFTEWEDTKRYLQQQLSAAIAGSSQADQRIALFSGSTSQEQRTQIKRAFNSDPKEHPVRILIATESAREGLNLQAHCWNLFHFDVPWNPSRMEQRNGRIDRKLQPKDEVFCHYFYYEQRPEDKVLKVLVKKTETIREELGSLSQVIDARLEARMKSGIRRKNVDSLVSTIESTDIDEAERQTMEAELDSSRQRQDDLRRNVDELSKILDRSRKAIGLKDELFQQAVSSSLELLGANGLQPLDDESLGIEKMEFPALDEREGADPSWADTIDTLRAPRERGVKLWEWRRDSPIRPVVFEDPGVVDDSVVHLHLEHRVVQRLLGRFISQGFVHDDLSRACMTQTKDDIPRVILLGRLALYGPNAARLHEQLVPVTAKWKDPEIRDQPLQPYKLTAEAKTMDLLDQAFEKPAQNVSDTIKEQLKKSAPQDINELLEHLQQRGEEYAARAIEKLNERAEAESTAMIDILKRQRAHIKESRKAADKRDWAQLRIQFEGDELDNETERRQLEANKKYWEKRLESLEVELKTEPDRIREVYSVKATRIEPVGIVYLWPETR